MIRRIALFSLLLLLVGCTPATNCPAVQCPTCNCQAQQTQDYLNLYFLDVGQGDSELIQYKDQEILIDCGKPNQGPKVLEYLKTKNVTRLDYLIMTHPDADHIGGCEDVLSHIPTTTVITNGIVGDTQTYRDVMAQTTNSQVMTSFEGQTITIGPATMTVIQSLKNSTDNGNSIVTRLVMNNIQVLYTADCDSDCEDSLLNKDIQATVLKVAHHGTKFATEIDFLEKVKPRYAVIEVGINSYGHPSQDTLDRLTQQGVTYYRTDLNGDITIKTDGNIII